MLQYHLSSRTTKVGKNKGKTVYYAQYRTRGLIPFDVFCREVADGSTVDVADVKAVLSRLHTVITRNIERGFSVEVGELGNFRPTFGSAEVLDPKDFDITKHVRSPKITFRPRPIFAQSLRANIGFERVELSESKDKEKKSKKKARSLIAQSPRRSRAQASTLAPPRPVMGTSVSSLPLGRQHMPRSGTSTN